MKMAPAQVILNVLGDHGTRKAVFGIVRQRDSLTLGLEGLDTQDRAKDFFAPHLHVRLDVGDNGRAYVKARRDAFRSTHTYSFIHEAPPTTTT